MLFTELIRPSNNLKNKVLENTAISELSNQALAKYKTAAASDAGAADKAGDFKRGNKRFSGIVKATKKQFANDQKSKKPNEQGVAEGYSYTGQIEDPEERARIHDLKKLYATFGGQEGLRRARHFDRVGLLKASKQEKELLYRMTDQQGTVKPRTEQDVEESPSDEVASNSDSIDNIIRAPRRHGRRHIHQDSIDLLADIQKHLEQWTGDDDDDYYEAWEEVADTLGLEHAADDDSGNIQNGADVLRELLDTYQDDPNLAAAMLNQHLSSTGISVDSIKSSLTSRADNPNDWRYKARAADDDQGVAEDKDPCWKGYKQVGMKKKSGKKVPNCVPVSEDCEQIMSAIINQILINETVQNNRR